MAFGILKFAKIISKVCKSFEFVSYLMARGQGFEPRYQGPEPCVLPLDDPRLN